MVTFLKFNKLTKTQALRIAIIACMVIALSAPLVVYTGVYFPYIVPKHLVFRAATVLMLLFYVVLALVERRRYIRWSGVFTWLFAFLAWLAVTAVFGIGFERSFWGNFERMGGLLHYIHLFVFAFVALQIMSQRLWNFLVVSMLVIGYHVALLTYFQMMGIDFILNFAGGDRVSSTVGNPAFLASYCLLLFFLSLHWFWNNRGTSLRWFAAWFIGIDGYLLLATLLNFVIEPSGLIGSLITLPIAHYIFSNPIIVSIFLLPQCVVAFWYIAPRARVVVERLLIILFVFQFIVVLFATATRGAAIGLLVGILALGILATVFKKITLRHFIILFGGLIVVMGLLALNQGALVALSDYFQPSVLRQFFSGVVRFSGLPAVVTFASMLSVVISVLLAYKAYHSKRVITHRPWVIGSVSILLFICVVIGLRIAGQHHDSYDLTTETRVLTWNASLDSLFQSPKALIMGYGLEHFYYAFNSSFPAGIIKDTGSRIWFDRAHNIIFDTLVVSGLVGLVMYLLLYGSLVRNALKIQFSSGGIVASLLVAFFIQNMFVFDTLVTDQIFVLIISWIAWHTRTPLQKVALDRYRHIFSALCLVVITTLGFTTTRIALASAELYSVAAAEAMGQSPAVIIEGYSKLSPLSSTGGFEAREKFIDYVLQLFSRRQLPAELLDSISQQAVFAIQQNIEVEPYNVRHYIDGIQLYNARSLLNPSAVNEALRYGLQALALSPSRPHIYFEIGRSYALLNQLDKVKDSFEQGIALIPEVVFARQQYIQVLAYFGDYQAIENQLTALESMGYATTQVREEIVDILEVAHQYKAAIQMLEVLIERYPDVPEYSIRLTEIRDTMGNTTTEDELQL